MARDSAAPGVAEYDAVELRDRIASGAFALEDLAGLCTARIKSRDHAIKAWAWHDPDFTARQTKALEAMRVSGQPPGALHGMPVGIKDIIDVAGIPCENGARLDAGRVPETDAFIVSRLKAAGAVLMGKTVTTELAFLEPAATRNPHNPDHTPGGSSSGSAAAVADGMVPLAIGTQTNGSVLRPASFCGVVGFKPTFGAIPRRGILAQSPSLDSVGVFATNVGGAAMLAETLFGYDATDPATRPAPHPQLLKQCMQEPPMPPVFAFVKIPGYEKTGDDMKAAIEEICAHLGEQVFRAELPDVFNEATALRDRIHFAEMARQYHRYGRKPELLGDATQKVLEAGGKITAPDYLAALDWPHVYRAALDEIFSRCDAILCPASTGAAPKGLATTGDPALNGFATFLGLPAISLPLFRDADGMPMGLQLIGARYNDGRLLRTARWLQEKITAPGR